MPPRCGYCKQEDTNFSHGMWAHVLATRDYQDLIDRGWRRSGQYCYKPTMARTCCPLYTISCAATTFRLSKSHKKALKKFRNFVLKGRKASNGVEGGEEEGEFVSLKEGERGEEEQEGGLGEEAVQERSRRTENVLGLTEVPDCVSLSPPVEEAAGCSPASTLASTLASTPSSQADPPAGPAPLPGPGHGQDPCKPRQGKAKAQRKARRQARQAAAGRVVEPKSPRVQERSVDDWLELNFGGEAGGRPAHVFSRRLVPADEDDPQFRKTFLESLGVYQRYQQAVHGDPADKCTPTQFKRFLCKSPLVAGRGLGSFHQHYLLDGAIFAVGVIDILPRCVSSVYLYYDPAYSFLSPGTLTSLLEVGLVRSLALTTATITSYYLGFYIHNCVKMRYKGRYSPSFLACPETFSWQPVERCSALLDQAAYARLDPDPQARDPGAGGELGQIGVLYCRQVGPGLNTIEKFELMKTDLSKALSCPGNHVRRVPATAGGGGGG